MFTHLRKDRTNIQMNITWVRHLKTIIHCLLTKVQVIILDFERFFQERKRTPQFFSAAEDTSEVVIRDGAVPITLIRVSFRFFQQFQRN